MYVIAHFIERKGMTDELLRDALNQRFPSNLGIAMGKTAGFAYMPFTGTSEDARAVLGDEGALPGTGKVMWFEPYMMADIRAALDKNDSKSAGCGHSSADHVELLRKMVEKQLGLG